MRDADLSGCDELRAIVGWNQTMDDWRRFLALAPDGCFVAERDGTVAGTVTAIEYEREIGWIGMLLVHPAARGQGIGKTLLKRAIEHLQQARVGCIKLDATPKGEPLYRPIGFREEWPLTRFAIRGSATHTASGSARELREADLPAAIALDAEAFGAARVELLRRLCRSARGALVTEENGTIAGFGLLRAGAVANYLGPLTAKSKESVGKLAGALTAAGAGRPIYWDVPEPNAAAVELAKKLGFEPQRPLLRMYLGDENRTGNTNNYFGLADPALG